MSRQLSFKEAANELGVSLRTIYRRVKSGELQETTVDGTRVIVMTDDNTSGTEGPVNTPTTATASEQCHEVHDTTTGSDTEMSLLRTKIAELQADRDRWHAESDSWRHMSEVLSQRLSEVTGTLYRLNEQKALAPPPPVEVNQRRPWWMFWAPRTRAEA